MTALKITGKLVGKVAIVTGSSSGNGRAIARRLASEGASVVCSDLVETPNNINFDNPDATHELIIKEGGAAIFVKTDVSNGVSVTNLITQAMMEFGRLDITVANAGISPQPPVHLPEETFETFQRVMSINANGAWWTAREASRVMREQGEGGRIVLISSIAGLLGTDSGVHYCMSKGAVNQLTRALAAQIARHGITVNAVCPGFVRTGMTEDYLSVPHQKEQVLAAHPLGRVGETEDIAGAVNFLCGPDAAWITGVLLPVDGGYSAV